MKKTLAHIIKHLFVATALVAFMLQLANIAVNTHFHISETGQVVKHSHADSPFKSSQGNHKHSSDEFCSLDIQSFFETVYIPELGSLFLTIHPIKTFELAGLLKTTEHITYAGRAPPCFSIWYFTLN